MANFCIYCGNPVAEKDGFCRTCGRKLLNTPETTQPKSAASASGTAQNTGRSIPRAAQMLVGYTRKISFPEGQREVSIELIPGAGSSAGSAAVLTNIRNPFLTLLGGFRTLISGFPKLFKNVKALIPMIVIAVLWIVLGIINWKGNTNLFTDILSWPIFAKAGFGGGFAGVLGGIVGKGLIGAGYGSLFTGGAKKFGQGVKDIFRGRGINLGSLLFGFGLSGLVYVFSAGYAGRSGSMVGIVGIFLSLGAVSSKTGFIHSFAASLSAKKGQDGTKSLVTQQYKSFLGGSAGSFALFASLSGIFGVRETGPVWYIILLLFCIAGIVLMLISKNRKGAAKASAVLAALVLFLGHAALFALPVRASEDEDTGYWEFVEKYDLKSESLVYEGNGYVEEIKGSASDGFYAVNTITADGYRFSQTSEKNRHHNGTSCKGEYGDASWTFSPLPPSRLNPGENYAIEAEVTGSCSAHIVGVGAQVMISYMYAEKSNNYIYFRQKSDDRSVITPSEIRQNEGTDGSFGAYVGPFSGTFEAQIPKGNNGSKSELYILFRINSHSCEIDTYYRYRWVDTSAAAATTEAVTDSDDADTKESGTEADDESEEESTERDYIIQTEETRAEINPGEDEGTDIIGLIITGVIGTAVGTAAAGASTEDDEKKKKSYKMKIYKEFGDTIRPGEQVPVYARIVEVIKGTEYDRPQLSKDIVIQSHDEVFITEMYASLAGSYKCATVEVNPAQEVSNEGVIDFIYRGEGGVFINSVTFKAKMPEILFYQPNMALVSCDERGGAVCFTVDGLAPEKTGIDLRFIEGSSYSVALSDAVTEQGEPIPGTHFACIADINKDPGPSGTYAVHTLEVRATDGRYTAVGTFEVYRVTTGLSVDVELLNCFRVLKAEAAGKQVDELQDSDFDISYTPATVMVVKVDEEKHEMYFEPALPKFRFEPLDPEDSLMKERLDGLGIKASPVNFTDSKTDYVFFCEKGFLEAPARLRVRMLAEYTDEQTGETERCDKTVMLLSQPLRETVTASMLEQDDKIRERLYNLQDIIWRNAYVLDLMYSDYLRMTTVALGYDRRFGYDPLTIATFEMKFERAVHFASERVKRELRERQELFLQIDETLKADDNDWSALSESLAMVQDKYFSGIGGMAIRIGLGLITSGGSEIPFLAMDINKGVRDYKNATLLRDRTWYNKLYAGAKPVLIAAAIGYGIKKALPYAPAAKALAKDTFQALIPPGIRDNVGKWVINTRKAVLAKIPEKWVDFGKGLKKGIGDVRQGLRELADDINSYDPRNYVYGIRRGAVAADAANTGAKQLARKDVLMVRKGLIPRTKEGLLIDKMQQARELNAAYKLQRFKKAYDRYLIDKSDDALKEYLAAGEAIQEDSFALNALNAEGKTAYQIEHGIQVSNRYRAGYNYYKIHYVDEAMLPIMTKKAAAVAHVPEKNITVIRATGKTKEAIRKAWSSPSDTDNSFLIEDPKTGTKYYMSQPETTGVVAESYCDAKGKPYANTAEALKYSDKDKVVGVAGESPELYGEFPKLKSAEEFTNLGIEKNMRTGAFKITHGPKEMDRSIRALMANPAKTAQIEQNLDNFLARKTLSLNQETLDATDCVELAFDGIHQGPKTYNLYVEKDLHAQALGQPSGFTPGSRQTVEMLRLAENQGTYRLQMGEMRDLLRYKGTDFNKAIDKMVLDFRTVNTNCRTANESISAFLLNAKPRSTASGWPQT